MNLRGLIDSRKKDLQGKEEFQEELDYYKEIENLCFGANTDPSDIEANRWIGVSRVENEFDKTFAVIDNWASM